MDVNDTKVKASDHEDHLRFTLIAIILPIVGFILGIVYLTKDNRVDKKLGEHLLAVSVLVSIVFYIGYYLLVSRGSTATYVPVYQ